MSTKEAENVRQDSEAARQAAHQAVEQARETANQAVSAMQRMNRNQFIYFGCLAAVVVSTLIFDMASFSVLTPDVAVSETTAQAQRDAEAMLNSWSYSAFTSSVWGKLAWLSALAGIGLLMASVLNKLRGGWLILSSIGCAALTTLLMLLLFFVGFPDLSAYSDARCSSTWLGYWFPLFASAGATVAAVKQIVDPI
ncbi:MAG: hypothetical protein AAF623_07180 [Planctomycetota bacterium]